MKRSELSVGQTVYIKPTGNAVRYGTGIIETKVSKIGTKYIETEKFGDRHKFNISDGKEKHRGYGYGYDYILYLTKQEINDMNEREKLLRNLHYDWYSFDLTLDQLRMIKAIIDEGKKDESNSD